MLDPLDPGGPDHRRPIQTGAALLKGRRDVVATVDLAA